ncbi:MAG: outer membrane beta-barrel protein [Dysgonamonadaceae bacterium]|jgi:hypothetical protein|nr:outer membrane beta-barrel protein [Dysgonamonadaceae bacterium]
MKGIKFVISSLLLLCSFGVIAQSQYTVRGILIESITKENIEGASVSVLNAKDSTEVTGGVSSRNGAFSLKFNKRGDFLLNIGYVGYKSVFQPFSVSGTTTINLGTIELVEDAIELGEAVVKGKKPEVVVRNDTIEYDATSYKTEENAVVEDLLKKLPGVEVDKDGKITINGKEIKKFLVDGKEFVSDDPKVASRNLPAEMVDKLQVLDRKSDLAQLTGFDDGEEESVINITVRPGMKQGTMGNVAVGLGKDVNANNDGRYMAGGMVNHMKNNDRYTVMINSNNTNNMGASDMGEVRFGGMRGMRGGSGGIVESQNIMLDMNKEFSDKLSLNGTVSYRNMERNTETEVESATFSERVSQLDKSLTRGNNVSDNLGLNFRLEWKPDSNNTIIFRPNISYNKSHSDQDKLFSRYNYNTLDTLFDGVSGSHYQGEGYYLGGSLEYSHKFNKPGRVFSAQLRTSYNDNYSQGYSDWTQKMYNDGVYDHDSIRDQRSENDNVSTNLRLFVSYVEPIGRNNFIQAVYRGTYDNTESINSTYNIYENDIYESHAFTEAVLYGNQSRSTLRNSLTNRFSLAFKSVRQKFNYTVGMNIDPSSSGNKTYQPYNDQILTENLIAWGEDRRLPNIIGDSLISEIKQNVFNLSPTINFNYLFGQRSNLRIDYEGQTNQPSANQLRDYIDESDPMNITKGNPNLKPGYTSEFRARFNKFVPESQMFYNVNLSGNMSINDIASVTTLKENGGRETTYKNINGNWNVMFMGGFNTPLKNKKFTIGNFVRTSYANQKSYSNDRENTQKNLMMGDNLRFNFRCSLFDIGTNFSLNYRKVTNEISPQNNLETYDWGIGGNTTWYLPRNITLASDITWTKRNGYADGFNVSETMWNASASKQLFNKRYGAGTFKITIYDVLQDRNSISGGNTTNGYNYTRSNVIPSYFTCSFIYKFTIFPKGSAATETDVRGERRWEGPGGGGGGRGPGGGGPGRPF